MPSLQCGDVQIYYQEQGQGWPVLFLHGYPQNHGIWNPLIRSFGAGFRLCAVDLPGFGRSQQSPATTYYYAQQVSRLLAWIDACCETPVDLVSHDYGSLLALGICAVRPASVRSLVIANTRGHLSFRQPWYGVFRALELCAQNDLGRWYLARSGLGFWHRLLVEWDYWEKPRPQCDPGLQKQSGIDALINFYRQGYQTAIDPDFARQVRSIQTPTLILWGVRDRYLSLRIAQELQQMIAGSRLKTFPEGCHYLIEQFPERVCAEIKDFLNSTAPVIANQASPGS